MVFSKFKLRTFNIKLFLIFFLGYLPALFQFLWVWLHIGDLWAYDRGFMAVYGLVNNPPYVEMIVFTIPSTSAYNTAIADQSMDAFSFFCVKLFKGFFSYYPAVYLGNAPYDDQPYLIQINYVLLFKIYFSFIGIFITTVFGVLKGTDKQGMLIILGFVICIFTAWFGHVESRYFILPRILYCCFIFMFLMQSLSRIKGISYLSLPRMLCWHGRFGAGEHREESSSRNSKELM